MRRPSLHDAQRSALWGEESIRIDPRLKGVHDLAEIQSGPVLEIDQLRNRHALPTLGERKAAMREIVSKGSDQGKRALVVPQLPLDAFIHRTADLKAKADAVPDALDLLIVPATAARLDL